MGAQRRQPELVMAMLEPGFYPGAPGGVELRETHASWVFLAGELAYKVKKPITLPFLDYGTLERRREMCREEVRLNRRLAPDYYLGVDSVVRRDGSLILAEGELADAVEYVVRMHKVPEERTLERLIARGELRGEEVDAIARRVADFHREAAVVPAESGGLAKLTQTLEQNIDTLRRVGPPTIPAARVEAADHFTSAFLAGRGGALLERGAVGLIREGHGDLRAEHVIVADGVQVYDCVEFDPALREIDVADDLAFLVMDLARMGADEAARRLVASYRAAGGDPGGEGLLSFYAAYRAWVRAKVGCLRAAELPQGDAEARRESERAFELMCLGHRFAWRARLPVALVLCGVAASGKTLLARRVAAESGLEPLNSDVVRKRLAGLAPTEHASPAHYSDEFDRRTYRELGRLAAGALERRGGAILDATFRRRADRDAFRAGLANPKAPVLFAECRAPADILRERARARETEAGRVSDADLGVVERQLGEFEPLDEVPAPQRTVIPTDVPLDQQLLEVERLADRTLSPAR